MNLSMNSALACSRRRPLAACIAALFALAAPAAMANNLIVGSCIDDGSPGTLRSVVASAQSGDTVDMTALNCSQISLTTGAIKINQPGLTIQGPGVNAFPIVGNQITDTILDHEGGETLVVNDLDLRFGNGHTSSMNPTTVSGGCIYSTGSVFLVRSQVSSCYAYARTGQNSARGGGVYVRYNLIMEHSTVSNNIVDAKSTTQAALLGGGAFVGGSFGAKYSTISYNTAGFANYGNNTFGGGLFLMGNVAIDESTIAGNFSRHQAGGIEIFGVNAGSPIATITNSTISGNTAPAIGGLYSNEPTTISNSTIASNLKFAQTGNAAGATFGASFGPITVNLHSTLIANNLFAKSGSPSVNDDLGVTNTTSTTTVTFTTDTQQGNFNLIRVLDPSVSASSLPPDTIIGQCPLLGPLKNNGGETQTHALYSGSPAIDAGVNNLGLAYDQRGGPQPPPNPIPQPPLAYDRHSGTRTDIGAYEVQQGDIIFNTSFEGCPDLQ